MRAQADGIGALYRRAFALYSEYFPKFLKLSLIAHIPVFLTTVLLIGFELAENAQPQGLSAVTSVVDLRDCDFSGILQVASHFLAAASISGMTAVIVTQLSLAPLRPVELRLAFAVLKRRWRPFLKTSIRITLRIVIGFILLVIPGIVMTIRYALYAPVVLLEGLGKKGGDAASARAGLAFVAHGHHRVGAAVFDSNVSSAHLIGRLTFVETHGDVAFTLQTAR